MAPPDGTMGALLLGVVVSAALWGTSCSQVFYYYTRYANDPSVVKLLVAGVMASDTIHQALITYSIYWYLIIEYGNPSAPLFIVRTMLVEMIFQGITSLLVQGFYAARVWKLSDGNLFFAIPVAAMVLTEFGVSLAYCITGLLRIRTFADLAKVRSLSACINIFAAVPDVVIAAILCVILHQSRTGFSRSNTMINRLIAFSINTGLLTSICACLSLIMFFALPHTFYYIFFYFLMGRLYSNSLMATLNARKSLRKTRADAAISLADVHFSSGSDPANPTPAHANSIAIRIDTTLETKHDSDQAEGDSEVKSFDTNMVWSGDELTSEQSAQYDDCIGKDTTLDSV